MDIDSFNNQMNVINNQNQSIYSNLDYDALTAELHSYYIKYKDSNNKKQLIRGLLHKTDFSKLFSKLINNNYTDELFYLLENFEFNNNRENLSDLFFIAIEKHRNKLVEYMIKNDYINLQEIKDKEGNSGLIIAAIYSNVQAAKIIIKFDASVLEIKNKHQVDPLTIAVFNNDSLMFFLIANNMTVPILNLSYLCKLAIHNENLDILLYLVNKNTNIFNEDQTLLHYSCSQRNLDIIKYVIKHTKSFDHKDESEETALHWAVMKGSYHIIEELISHIKEHNASINPRNKFGVTPFHLACLKQDKYVSNLLFDNGADANEQDNEGNSVIHIAAAIGDLKWLKYMVKHFNINTFLKNNHGNTPFMVACIAGKYDIVKYFIDKIPSLTWKNNKGQTPAHAAVYGGHIHILELLLTYKADITIKDINGLTPYHYAYAEKKADIIETIHRMLGH